MYVNMYILLSLPAATIDQFDTQSIFPINTGASYQKEKDCGEVFFYCIVTVCCQEIGKH